MAAAGGSVIGALRVVIGADTVALDKGLKDAQGSLANFSASMGKVAAAATAAFAGLGGALGLVIKGAINDADKLGNMAQAAGISVEELSKLKFAAELSGISLETLATALEKLSKNMSDAAREPAGQLALAFQTIGIKVRESVNGPLKSSSQVLSELAAKFATYKDGAEKTALAQVFFGKTGAALIPLLNAGANGIAEMKKEAESLGIVISTETSKAAEEFNKNLTRLSATKSALVLLITSRLLKSLESLSAQLIQGIKDSDGMKTASEGLIFVIKGLATAAISAWTSMKAFSSVIAGVIAASILAAQGQFQAAFDALMHGGEDAAKAVDQAGKLIEDVWKDRIPEAAKAGADEIRKSAAPIVASAADIKKAAAEAEAALKKIFEAGKKTYEDTRTPAEAFGLQLQKLNQQYAEGAISADTYARAVQKIQWPSMTQAIQDAGNMQKQLDSFSTNSLNSTASALTDIVTNTKSAADAFKELAQSVIRDLVQMTIKAILFKTVVAPLFGFSDGGSLGVGSGGVSSFLGFASGGSFMVPGGMSMTDNHMVPIKVASGERVTVDRPNSPSSQAPSVTLNMRPGRYTREEVRGIFDVANKMFADGYRLKMA